MDRIKNNNLNMNSNKKISTESQSSEKTPLIFQEKTFMSLHIPESKPNLSISLKAQNTKEKKIFNVEKDNSNIKTHKLKAKWN